MSFQNKIVWITGASSGIGEALTYELNRQGAKIIISSRRQKALQNVKKGCRHPSNVHVIPLDLSETEKLTSKTEEAVNKWGTIDYLFNNGGISQRSNAIDTNIDVIRQVMEINFFGTVALTKAVLPKMIAQKSGHIIVTSSVMGKFGTRLRSSYSASKHALHGYFDSLRQEVYDKNITISLVCPGFIKTNVTKNALEGDGSKHNKMGAGQKNGMPVDEFVQKLIPKIKLRKEEIYIGGREIWAVYLKRLFPRLLNKLLRNTKVT